MFPEFTHVKNINNINIQITNMPYFHKNHAKVVADKFLS